ncbi:unnamed protein product [Sphagnum troendelagicum]|uniref:Uncharacterized protein n=1 Tax=Sphagnum troendelagicum TaxID=128251 RepID=A0ABP0UDH3_9BRYO
MPPSYQQHSCCCLPPFCRCRLLFFFAAPTKVFLVTRVWSLRVLSEKRLSFWPEQGEHVSVKTQGERVSVKKKKEAGETCVQVKGFFNGDVERDLRILVNAVWFLCLLSCLAVEEEESCRVCCVCRISKSSISERLSAEASVDTCGRSVRASAVSELDPESRRRLPREKSPRIDEDRAQVGPGTSIVNDDLRKKRFQREAEDLMFSVS